MNTLRQKQGTGVDQVWYRVLIGLWLLACSGLACAAEGQRWTLAQCLERAQMYSPDVAEAQAEVRIAESQLAQAKAGRLPQVTFTNIGGVVNAARGNAVEGHTENGDLGPFSKGELEVVQLLYAFGRLAHEIRAATLGVETKQAATQRTRTAVIATVKELYYNLLLSRQTKTLLDEIVADFTKALETAEKRLEEGKGTVTQQDILRLRIGLASVSKETFTLERAVIVTRETLMRQLRIPRDTNFDIADTILEPLDLALQPLEVYLEQASQTRPELAQLVAGLAARQARLDAARSAYFPTVFLAGGVRYAVAPNRDDQHNPFVKDEFNFLDAGLALGLRWKLDFWMTRAKEAERQAELSQVEIQKENATSGIILDIQRRYLEVQETQQKIEAAQTARKAGRALLVTTLTNFGLGIGSGKDVFEGLGLYSRVATDYYTTVRDFNVALARLSQAIGQEVTPMAPPTVSGKK